MCLQFPIDWWKPHEKFQSVPEIQKGAAFAPPATIHVTKKLPAIGGLNYYCGRACLLGTCLCNITYYFLSFQHFLNVTPQWRVFNIRRINRYCYLLEVQFDISPIQRLSGPHVMYHFSLDSRQCITNSSPTRRSTTAPFPGSTSGQPITVTIVQ
jgi:hypothetical protein